MKRSTVNEIMADADKYIHSFGYKLPPFAYWTPQEMVERKGQMKGIIDAGLGWDITDYGIPFFLLLFRLGGMMVT